MWLVGKRNDDEGAEEKLYTYASHIPVARGEYKVRFMLPPLQHTSAHVGAPGSPNRRRGVIVLYSLSSAGHIPARRGDLCAINALPPCHVAYAAVLYVKTPRTLHPHILRTREHFGLHPLFQGLVYYISVRRARYKVWRRPLLICVHHVADRALVSVLQLSATMM